MQTKFVSFLLAFSVALTALGFELIPPQSQPAANSPNALQSSATPASPASVAQLSQTYGKIPLSFEPNQGQTDSSVDFVARGVGYTIFLRPGETTLALKQPNHKIRSRLSRHPSLDLTGASESGASRVVRMKIVNATNPAAAEGLNRRDGIVNYFSGNDPKKWHTNIPTFRQVQDP